MNYQGVPSTVRIPKGMMWVEGDNWMESTDSRTFGPVPMALVHGRIAAIVLPLHRARTLKPKKGPV